MANNSNENWGEIALDNLDDLLKEVENFGSNNGVNAGANNKGSGKKETSKGLKASNLSTVLEAEEDDEDELENEEDEDGESSDPALLNEDDDGDDIEVEDSDADGGRGDDAKRADDLEELRREAQENQRALAEARLALQRAEQQAEKATKERSTLLRGNLEAQRDRFDLTAKTLKAQIIKAREESDYVSEEDLREKLQEINLRRMAVTADLEALENPAVEQQPKEEAPARQPNRPLTVSDDIPRATRDFIKRNEWITSASDSERMVLANMSQLLIDQGGDPATEAFYDDLTEALKNIKGLRDKVVAKTKTVQKGSPVAPKAQTSEPTKRTKVYRSADGKTKVKVTKDDVEMARRLGFDDPKQYIREKVRLEKQTGGQINQWSQLEV